MTVTDLRCDVCALPLSGMQDPSGGGGNAVRFTYHPGDPGMRDESGALCARCWQDWVDALGEPRGRACATCGDPVRRRTSLHLRRMDDRQVWQLCRRHAADLLNTLRTVDPKLDRDTFRLPLDTTREDDDG